MRLEEMQAALDSEARQKAAKLEKENRHLTTAIRKKQERIDRLEESLRDVYTRCFDLQRQAPFDNCTDCAQQRECRRLRSAGK